MNVLQWLFRFGSIINIVWNGVCGELICDIGQFPPEPCHPSRFGNGLSVKQCINSGCCYADDPQNIYPKYYKKVWRNELGALDVNWQPTRSPSGANPELAEYLVHGGEGDFAGNQLLKFCHPLFRGDLCFKPWVRVSWEMCERSHCCWTGYGCYKSKLHITHLRKQCPLGFKNPPRCEDVDDCAGSPCGNNGKCIKNNNGFTCQCDPPYSGEFCTEACESAAPSDSDGNQPMYNPPNPNGPPFAVGTEAKYMSCSDPNVPFPADRTLLCDASTSNWSPSSFKCLDCNPSGPFEVADGQIVGYLSIPAECEQFETVINSIRLLAEVEMVGSIGLIPISKFTLSDFCEFSLSGLPFAVLNAGTRLTFVGLVAEVTVQLSCQVSNTGQINIAYVTF